MACCLFASVPLHAETPHLIFASANILNISEQHTDNNSGMAIELIQDMSQTMNFTYEVHYYPWSRAVDVIRQGKADVLVGVYYSDSRAEIMDYTQVALYQDEIRLYTNYGSEFDWQGDINQLLNKRIALIRGGSYGRALDHFKENMEVMEVTSVEQQFRLLRKGRIDVTANNVRNTSPILEKLKLQYNFTSHKPALALLPGYFAFSKKSKYVGWRQRFDNYLLKVNETGELKALQQRFNPKD